MAPTKQFESHCAPCAITFRRRARNSSQIIRSCAECECPFVVDGRDNRKFCCTPCRLRHNVQSIINRIKELTFTISETTNATGLSESVVRYRVVAHKIQTFKVDRQIRIRRSDAMRLVTNHGRRAK